MGGSPLKQVNNNYEFFPEASEQRLPYQGISISRARNVMVGKFDEFQKIIPNAFHIKVMPVACGHKSPLPLSHFSPVTATTLSHQSDPSHFPLVPI